MLNAKTSQHARNNIPSLKHYDSDTTSLLLIYIILRINASGDWRGSIVIEIKVQLTVSDAKFLRFKKQGVIQKCKGIKDVEVKLYYFVSR